jgi:hypothetical protein
MSKASAVDGKATKVEYDTTDLKSGEVDGWNAGRGDDVVDAVAERLPNADRAELGKAIEKATKTGARKVTVPKKATTK